MAIETVGGQREEPLFSERPEGAPLPRYKVLVADDEYWTREKLRTMLQWEEYGLTFLEPAADGEEVLAKIQQDQPDILITDINMPFLNGVELLAILQKQYPQIVTFVISGYDDFAYVKDTFMAGAINYLLKPVTKIDLVGALTKALQIISGRQSEQEEARRQKLQILKASSLIEDREYSRLLEREDAAFAKIPPPIQAPDLAGTSLMLIKIHYLKNLARSCGYDMNLLSYSVKKELGRFFDQDGVLIFNHIYRSNEFLVISELDPESMKRAAERVMAWLSKEAQSPLTICISGRNYTMDSIYMAYVQTVAMLMERSYSRTSEVKRAQEAQKGTARISGRLGEEQEKQFKSLLRKGNRGGIRKLIFDTIGLRSCQEQPWGYLEVKQTVKKLLNLFMDWAAGHMEPRELVDLESMADQADKTVESLDAQALCEVLEDVLTFVVPEAKEAPTDSVKDIVRQAVAYVDAHYFEDISLASLAGQFHVEGSYFSRVFRQETGKTIMVYITGKRMEKAIEYMKDPGINLTEIAFLVGYDDYTYFSRVFRKAMGVSPREYRSRV